MDYTGRTLVLMTYLCYYKVDPEKMKPCLNTLYFIMYQCVVFMLMNLLLCSAKRSAVVRASDDFWPRDPASHTIHIASVAYNTIFLGEFMLPDWDMFHVG